MRLKLLPLIAALLPLAACNIKSDEGGAAPTIASAGVTDALIAQVPEGEWLSYGRDYGEQRFSPLAQVNDGNVGQLGLAWFHDLETARGQEATPLMHDGTLYIST
ncbi:MAG: PQQ-dependent dehydrogenase, methanol/ethanol family, partial [Novosphingobium sp.]|nr:PQQ-dependent dehydrogenase, methanol/ethanol family [Novosphingobium sp.]